MTSNILFIFSVFLDFEVFKNKMKKNWIIFIICKYGKRYNINSIIKKYKQNMNMSKSRPLCTMEKRNKLYNLETKKKYKKFKNKISKKDMYGMLLLPENIFLLKLITFKSIRGWPFFPFIQDLVIHNCLTLPLSYWTFISIINNGKIFNILNMPNSKYGCLIQTVSIKSYFIPLNVQWADENKIYNFNWKISCLSIYSENIEIVLLDHFFL